MKTENKDPETTTMAAGSRFATMLTRNARKIIAILPYAFLEWVLILLLLFNSLFAYLIRKFAAYFGLKPPCPWCSKLDHLLEPGKIADPYKYLVCETHVSEISKLTYCSNHKRLAESETMCEECFSSSQPKHSPKTCRCSCCEIKISSLTAHHPPDFPFKGEIQEEKDEAREGKGNDHGGNHSGSECEHQVLSDVGSFDLRETAEEDSNEDEVTGIDNVKEQRDCIEGHQDKTKIEGVKQDVFAVKGGKQIETTPKEEGTNLNERIDHLLLSADNKEVRKAEETLRRKVVSQRHTESCENDATLTIQQLKSDLEAERKAHNDLYAELEAERSAAAIAANQTMAMITRLQEEKAAMQMEALQYQRLMEEQVEYDQEALRLLNELVVKREREKQELEKELDVYRERMSDYEAKDKAMIMIQRCENENSPVDNDSDVLSIDLNGHYDDKDEDDKDTSFLEDCSKEWGDIEGSLEELEAERLSIIKQLKDLEEKLEPNVELCSQEVNLVSSCFTREINCENQPKTMASVAQRLLDIVESDDGETEHETPTSKIEVESGSKRLAIEKEMDHVYGRLQALEADTEFLRHCIGSVNKGNTGVNLLQVILQHLRELRAAEICM